MKKVISKLKMSFKLYQCKVGVNKDLLKYK